MRAPGSCSPPQTGSGSAATANVSGNEDHYGIGFAPLDLNPTPDTTRPNTFIDSGPSGLVSGTSATFSFSADESSVFQCRLDGAAFAPCTSPMTL